MCFFLETILQHVPTATDNHAHVSVILLSKLHADPMEQHEFDTMHTMFSLSIPNQNSLTEKTMFKGVQIQSFIPWQI